MGMFERNVIKIWCYYSEREREREWVHVGRFSRINNKQQVDFEFILLAWMRALIILYLIMIPLLSFNSISSLIDFKFMRAHYFKIDICKVTKQQQWWNSWRSISEREAHASYYRFSRFFFNIYFFTKLSKLFLFKSQ